MREIEFRGKVLEDDNFFGYKKGQWVFGNYSKDRLYNNIHIEDTSKEDIESIDVDPDTVGQYTGLTDKNGTKMFEGDIVKFIYRNKKMTGNIIWEYGRFAIYNTGVGYSITNLVLNGNDSIELLGNIHDNPELLEGT